MTEPTLDPLVQRAMLSNDVVCEVLPCDPDMADTAAFCAHYGFAMEQAANTILVASKKVAQPKYAACVVLGTTRLDVNKKVSELLAVKRLSFADEETTLGLTGMMIGGVTAFGLGDLPIYVDSAVMCPGGYGWRQSLQQAAAQPERAHQAAQSCSRRGTCQAQVAPSALSERMCRQPALASRL